MKTVVGFLIAMVLTMTDVGVCQEPSEKESREQLQRYHRLVDSTDEVYQITFDGLIHRNFVHRRVYRTPKPLLKILSDAEIAKDLKISAEQRKKLERKIDALDDACGRAKELYDNWDAQDADQLESDTLGIMEPPVESAIELIRDSLAEVQSDRFRQILLQLEIARRGMLWFVESKLGDEIGLTIGEKNSLKEIYVREVRAALKEIHICKQEAIDDLFSVVPAADRQKMQSLLGDRDNLFRTPLKLVTLQVKSDAVESFKEYQGESQWPRYAGISLPFSFNVTARGEIVFAPSDDSPENVDHAIPVMLMIFCLSDGELVLVPEQSAAMRELQLARSRMFQLQEQETNDWIEASGSQTIPDEMDRRHRLAREKNQRDLVPTIEGILLPHQKIVMQEFAARSRYSLHGPLAYISNYQKQTPGFALSSAQREKLEKKADEFRESTTAKLVELEARLNQRMLKSFTDQQKENFDRLVGDWVNPERGNLEFHATFVERPDEIWGLNQNPIWMDGLEVDPRAVDASSEDE